MKYHLKAKNSDNAHCGLEASPAVFIYELEQFHAHFNSDLRCKKCGRAAEAMKVSAGSVMILSTKKGYDASVEISSGIFHLRSVYETENNFTSIDVYAEDGTYLDEYASGFGIGYDLSDKENLKNLGLIAKYINENIIL